MNAVDTNVLVYSIDRRDLVKRAKARVLLKQLRFNPIPTLLLWQVAGEFVRVLRAWQAAGQINRASVRRYLNLFRASFSLALPTAPILDRALDLADRFSLSHWDSMLLGACLEASVDILYTEDMGAPAVFDTVRLINPFI
jgi:predicted nucleic acid-binding protein